MGAFNYSSYAKAIQPGLHRRGMHPIALLLLGCIVQYPFVKDKNGHKYKISRTEARDWYHGAQGMPQGIRDGADNSRVVGQARQYFEDKVLPELYTDKEQGILDSIIDLIHDDPAIQGDTLNHFDDLYNAGDSAAFLSESFLYAVKGENGLFQRPPKKKKSKPLAEVTDIEEFENLMKQKYPKPAPMTPPAELADHELTYASELYAAYADAEGLPEMDRQMLDDPKYKKYNRSFNRQRKYYYMAETILEESRDTLNLKESECFDKAKEEVYDGVIDTCDRSYPDGFQRLLSVIDTAGGISLSQKIEKMLLDWMGPGEKKGICHMLVNDKRIRWVDEDD